jgi:hypothetical protein
MMMSGKIVLSVRHENLYILRKLMNFFASESINS